MKRATILTAVLCCAVACSDSEPPSAANDGLDTLPPTEAPSLAEVYAAAVNNPARSEADRERDAGRKPDKVLEFFGIKPGMRVLDLFSGGGYYTELLSYAVGDEGRVTAHTNEAYAQYVGEEAMSRYGNDRLPNVDILMAENNELDLPAGAYDAVMLILSFHDFFYVDPKNGWAKIDGPALLGELYEGLKPGGIVGIIDHYAEAGSPRETGNTLHRIDPEIVVADMQAAGFALDAKSDILRNMDDDYSKNMADPAVRGHTDRFVMRFVKPE